MNPQMIYAFCSNATEKNVQMVGNNAQAFCLSFFVTILFVALLFRSSLASLFIDRQANDGYVPVPKAQFFARDPAGQDVIAAAQEVVPQQHQVQAPANHSHGPERSLMGQMREQQRALLGLARTTRVYLKRQQDAADREAVLRAQLDVTEAQLSQKTEELDQTRAAVAAQITDSSTSNEALQKELDELRQQLDQEREASAAQTAWSQSSTGALREERDQLEQDLAKEKAASAAQKAESQTSYEALRAEQDNVKQQLSAARSANIKASTELQERQQEHARTRAELATVQKNAAEAQQQQQLLQSSNSDLQKALAAKDQAQQDDRALFDKAVAQASQENQNLHAALQSTQNSAQDAINQALEHQKQELGAQHEHMRQKFASVSNADQSRIRQLEQERDHLQNESSQLQLRLQQQQHQQPAADNIAQVQQENVRLRGQLNDAIRQMNAAQRAKENAEFAQSQAEYKLSDHERAIEANQGNQEQIARLSAENTRLNDRVSELEQASGNPLHTQQRIASLSEEVKSSRMAQANSERRFDKALKDLAEERSKNTKLQTALDESKRTSTGTAGSSNQMRNMLRQQGTQIQQQEKTIKELRAQIADSHPVEPAIDNSADQIKKLTDSINQRDDIVAEKVAEIARLQAEVDERTRIVEERIGQIDRLQHRLDERDQYIGMLQGSLDTASTSLRRIETTSTGPVPAPRGGSTAVDNQNATIGLKRKSGHIDPDDVARASPRRPSPEMFERILDPDTSVTVSPVDTTATTGDNQRSNSGGVVRPLEPRQTNTRSTTFRSGTFRPSIVVPRTPATDIELVTDTTDQKTPVAPGAPGAPADADPTDSSSSTRSPSSSSPPPQSRSASRRPRDSGSDSSSDSKSDSDEMKDSSEHETEEESEEPVEEGEEESPTTRTARQLDRFTFDPPPFDTAFQDFPDPMYPTSSSSSPSTEESSVVSSTVPSDIMSP